MTTLAQSTSVSLGLLLLSGTVIGAALIINPRILWPGYLAWVLSLIACGFGAHATCRYRLGLFGEVAKTSSMRFNADLIVLGVAILWATFMTFAIAYVHFLPLKGGAGPTS